eukprot:3854048-Amphidinium_carterae.1
MPLLRARQACSNGVTKQRTALMAERPTPRQKATWGRPAAPGSVRGMRRSPCMPSRTSSPRTRR